MKSEPDVFSIDDLGREGRTEWTGVRNYQARNFMRDDMRVGDGVLFYHSSTQPPGVAGLARISREAQPENERPWVAAQVEFVEKFAALVPLAALRADPDLAGLWVLRRGQRLSIQPVQEKHAKRICAMARRL